MIRVEFGKAEEKKKEKTGFITTAESSRCKPAPVIVPKLCEDDSTRAATTLPVLGGKLNTPRTIFPHQSSN